MLPGRSYLIKHGTTTVGASVTACKYKINVNSLNIWRPRRWNSTRSALLSSRRPAGASTRTREPADQWFILIDRMSNDTVGAGMLHFALRRAHNIHLSTWR